MISTLENTDRIMSPPSPSLKAKLGEYCRDTATKLRCPLCAHPALIAKEESQDPSGDQRLSPSDRERKCQGRR